MFNEIGEFSLSIHISKGTRFPEPVIITPINQKFYPAGLKFYM